MIWGYLSDLPRRDVWLWSTALALFVVGDTATTAVGLSRGLVESHPVSSAAVGALGFWAAIGLSKLVVAGWAAFGWGYCRRVGWDRWARAMPGVLAVFGVVIVAHNARLLLAVS